MTMQQSVTTANLSNRYRILSRAMRTCTDTDEYFRCMRRLDEIAEDLQRQGVDIVALDDSINRGK